MFLLALVDQLTRVQSELGKSIQKWVVDVDLGHWQLDALLFLTHLPREELGVHGFVIHRHKVRATLLNDGVVGIVVRFLNWVLVEVYILEPL